MIHDNIKVIKQTIKEALRNAKYSIDPIGYHQTMKARYDKIVELEKIDDDCIWGIKFSGNICYVSEKEIPSEEF